MSGKLVDIGAKSYLILVSLPLANSEVCEKRAHVIRLPTSFVMNKQACLSIVTAAISGLSVSCDLYHASRCLPISTDIYHRVLLHSKGYAGHFQNLHLHQSMFIPLNTGEQNYVVFQSMT